MYRTVIFLASTLAVSKPSEKSMISQICSRSGTIMVTGRKSALRLSGSSVRPAYPGFMVMKMPVRLSQAISLPSNWNLVRSFFRASWICLIWDDTTESTSASMRLNSSKQPQAPHCTRPAKMEPMAL